MNAINDQQLGQVTTVDQPTEDQFNRLKLKPDQYGVAGVVQECLPNTMFRVSIDSSDIPDLLGRELLFTLAGKMRLHRIRVMPGDKVQGYVTKYDLQRGKIVFRTK